MRSDLILGGAGYAGLYGPVDSSTAAATLDAAWDAGIRAFDTAPHYGAGLSEERLGAFLSHRPRRDVTVSTKVGRLLHDDPAAPDGVDGFYGTPKRSRTRDYSASGVRRSLDMSLTRLGLDAVDLLLVHDPDDHQDDALKGAVPELERLRTEGVVKGIGIGVNDADVAVRFIRESSIDHVLIAGRYSLLDRRAEAALLDECARRGITVQVAGVFNSGLLADPYGRTMFDYQEADAVAVERARTMAELCADYGVSLRAAALQFPMRHPAVHSVVSGAATPEMVTDTVDRLTDAIPEDLWTQLDTMVLYR